MKKNADRYYQSALHYHFPVKLRPELEGFVLHLARKNYFFIRSSTPFNNTNSSLIARNKYHTSKILQQAGLPVPLFVTLSKEYLAKHCLEDEIADLRFPLVAKPCLETSKGDDVLCNIKNIHQLRHHLTKLFERYHYANVEEYHGNLQSYRVLVFKRKVIGVVLRTSAAVEGDGEHTISELIEITNHQRAQESDILKPIMVDEECEISLTELGVTLDTIPKPGEIIRLGFTSNASRGGSYLSVGKTICRENKKLMLKAVRTLGLNLAGLDIECEDISVPIAQSKGVIIEVNNAPSIRIHEESPTGKPVDVTKIIMRSFMFRHPFSYAWHLLRLPQVQTYLRAIIVLLVFFGAFMLLK